MENINQYIKRSKEDRQRHLCLDEPCIERGGQSMYLKGLLAHILDTTIPSGKKIHVCHACHNGKCSNPYHLYWATPSDNAQDAIQNGRKSIWQKMVEKYGEDGAKEKQRRSHRQASLAGKGNAGKAKTEDHKRNIRLNHPGLGKPNSNAGRKNITQAEVLIDTYNKFGFKQGAEELGISYVAFQARYYRVKNKI